MDLLSLPEEMLASIYKYTDDPTMIKSRKLNTKINQVAVRNKLNKLCLKEFKFTLFDKEVEVFLQDFQGNEFEQNAVFSKKNRDETILSFVDNLFTKIRYTNKFGIEGEIGKPFSLPNELFHMMIKNSNGKPIYQLRCNFLRLEWDASLMRKFLTNFKFECLNLVGCEMPNLGQHSELFDGLSFDHLSLGFAIFLSIIDLNMICYTKVPQCLYAACNNVTPENALKFAMDAFGKKRKGDNLKITLLGINLKNITDEEIRSLLQPIEDVTTIDINIFRIRIHNATGVDIMILDIALPL